jgi:hypothetical protein
VAVGQLVYDDGQADENLGYGRAGGGLAVRITPRRYPCHLTHLRFAPDQDANMPVTVTLWDDDGPGGKPGTILGSIHAQIMPTEDGWLDVDISSLHLKIDDGNFYAGWIEEDTTYYNGFDMDPPYYDRTWVFSTFYGGWFPLTDFGILGNLMVRVRYLDDFGSGPVQNISTGKRYPTIQQAVDDAFPNEQLVLSPGTYRENIRIDAQNLLIRSTNPEDPAVVAATIIDGGNKTAAVTFGSGVTSRSVLDGLTIIGGQGGEDNKGGIACIALGDTGPAITRCLITKNNGPGIFCKSSSPTVTNCTIIANGSDGIELCADGSVRIANTVIARNLCHGIQNGRLAVVNCTVVENAGSGIFRSTATVTNSIIWGNAGPQVAGSIDAAYSDIQGGRKGLGNIDQDPCFVDPNSSDYHLMSGGWRWSTDANQWTWDSVTSRCIDAGNPGSALQDEPLTLDVDPLHRFGANLRIDMGAYGGTPYASMPPNGWALLADLNNDGTTDAADLRLWTPYWLSDGTDLPADLNRNRHVDFTDFAYFAQSWLAKTTWRQP